MISRTARLYWIRGFTEGHLAVMPAPPIEELEGAALYWKEEGVDLVVCLLESDEVAGYIGAEKELCEEFGLEFIWFPIKDRTVPSSGSVFDALISRLASAVVAGKSVAIHCRAGIGRSVMVATRVLNRLGVDAAAALDMVADARKIEVPQTEEQRQWILGHRSNR